MKLPRLAAGALNQIPLDWQGNRARALAAVAEAREGGAEWICLPEFALSGCGCEDRFLAPDTADRALESLAIFAKECRGLVVVIGLPLRVEQSLYSAAALIVDGEVRAFSARSRLLNQGIHYESRWFSPWEEGKLGSVFLGGSEIPVGESLHEIAGIRLRIEIGSDAEASCDSSADLIFHPSAEPFSFDSSQQRTLQILGRSQNCGYVHANLLGNEAGSLLYDGQGIVADQGRICAISTPFSFREWVVAVQTQATRQASPAISLALSRHGQFAQAVALGLFDYLRKSHSHGFVLSLSGGADSAAVATLVKIMHDLALAELGEAALRKRLGYMCLTEDPIMPQILACVYQATHHSSETTRHAAETLARAIGADYREWDVDGIVTTYRHMIEQSLGRELSWQSDDVALQNIQARVRAPGIWMLTNLRNALLLATGNRSEVAVGYATMDGDTAGGLSPIAGIDKAFLREWLRWMETEGLLPHCLSIPELRWINVQSPTAELRPPDSRQTDETDLMPYPVLNRIEAAAIRDRLSPRAVWEGLKTELADHDPEQLRRWVIRFFQLWCRNQWKRERYAPGFHLDDRNLDPKSWCRFPLLSSGYREELLELERGDDSIN